MRVITEVELRDKYKQAEFTSFRLPAGTRLTPSAQQFLSERKIKIESEGASDQAPFVADTQIKQSLAKSNADGYIILATNETVAEKPEHMTHIRGRTLVPKNHPRIKFRGKLDSLEALLLCTIVDVESFGFRELAKDLVELLEYTRQIMSAEVKGQPLGALTYHNLSPEEIRERSHYPNKFYGVGHLLPQPSHGKFLAQLNLIRTQCRELEVVAMDAFAGPPVGEPRPDISQALNRLSSLVYIMMVQLTSGHYKVG